MDRAADQPWTRSTLRQIQRLPGVVSTELAAEAGQERAAYKLRVRRLKALGLTESLERGYRLSPRGAGLSRSIRRRARQRPFKVSTVRLRLSCERRESRARRAEEEGAEAFFLCERRRSRRTPARDARAALQKFVHCSQTP